MDFVPLPVSYFETIDHEWTFGQVIALLLLTAPVIALVEGYLTSKLKFYSRIMYVRYHELTRAL
jgi:hypothetical protein